MASLRAERMIDDFGGNAGLIYRLVDGVADAESVLQLPFEADCLKGSSVTLSAAGTPAERPDNDCQQRAIRTG
jgi:hypothetical protein